MSTLFSRRAAGVASIAGSGLTLLSQLSQIILVLTVPEASRLLPVTGLAASGRAAICPPRGSSHDTMFCRTAGVRRPIVWTLPRANFTRQMSQFVLRP
jgi:hypothetical protein